MNVFYIPSCKRGHVMPRSHIHRYPSDFHFYGMSGYIFCGGREVPGENWSSKMHRVHKGAGLVSVRCRPVSLRAPSNLKVHPLTLGARRSRMVHWPLSSDTRATCNLKLRFNIIIDGKKSRGARPAPFGAHTGPGRCPTDTLRSFYGLNVRWKRRYNWEQPTRNHGARTAVNNVPAPVGTIRKPAGHQPNIPKMFVFTHHTGPGLYM